MEHRQRRKYILECAEKLFAEKGFDGVTVADIAKASEFSVGSIYLFFESKEEIIKQILFKHLDQFFTVINTEVEQDYSAVEKLDNVIAGIVDQFAKHSDVYKVYAREVKGSEWCESKEEFKKEIHERVRETFIKLSSVFKQGIEEGVFRDDIDPLYMTLFIDGFFHGLMHVMSYTQEGSNIHEVYEDMKKLFYHGILKRGKGKKK